MYFNFDQLSLAGSLEVVITGDASLEIKVSEDSYIGVPLVLNGANGGVKPWNPVLAVLMEESKRTRLGTRRRIVWS